MAASPFRPDRIDRLRSVLAAHTADGGGVPGLVWAVDRHGDTHVGAAGTFEPGGDRPVERDTIFRISSMSKPVTAVAALILVEECRLRLDDPIDPFLPELADRQVMVDPAGSLTDTVPANRPITLRDLLTFRMGIGMDFTVPFDQQPVLARGAELELGAGPPAPAVPPATDEWIRRLGTLPLAHQPGERWLYHVSADVLGVLVERASGQSFDGFLRERVFEPLGMADTGFSVPAGSLDRLGPLFVGGDPPVVYDPSDGQWSEPPAFCGGGAGLVSTVDDYLAFARMLRAGGGPILSRPTVDLMTTDHVGDPGWGFGVGVQTTRTDVRSPGTYSWDGGLGTSWANDPVEGLIGVLMTNQMFMSPEPPAVVQDFWTCAYAALAT
ncbi:MAG: beta-lactamase family protein [Acidimicrobiia bacterium]|nr:beta-lactamase family protein [Acidimicrobiia bacterium]